MKRTAPDRTVNQPKPVQRIELDEKHVKKRIILIVVLVLIAIAAFAHVIINKATVASGWREIEANSSSKVNCSQNFVFDYNLGASGLSASAENKAIVKLYTEATEKAYRVFNSRETFEGENNICSLNRNVNTPLEIPQELYSAFEKLESLSSRYHYLAPVYADYHSLFFCGEDWETAGFDAYQNADVRAYFKEIAAFAGNPGHVQVQLLGNNTAKLFVSEEYLAYAREYGIAEFVDFYWMNDAFIIDYLAEIMEKSGYTRGAISSYNGFVRCLSDSREGYSFFLYDTYSEGITANAARLNYPGGTSLVHLHNMPLNIEKEIYYYQFSDGSVRTAYLDMDDALNKTVTPVMIATSESAGCVETLMRLLPLYAADQLDEGAVMNLRRFDIHPVYIKGREIITTDDRVTVSHLFEGYTVTKK